MLKSNIPAVDKYDLAISFDEVLGLGLLNLSVTETIIPDNIKVLLKKRENLRKEGKYEEADKLRAEIEELGYSVSDKPAK